MRLYKKKIKQFQTKQNSLLVLSALLIAVSVLFIVLISYHFVFSYGNLENNVLFLITLTIKIVLFLLFLYYSLNTNRKLLTLFLSAKYIDICYNDKHDTFQNALELEENEQEDKQIIEIILNRTDTVALTRNPVVNKSYLKFALIPFLLTSFIFSIMFICDNAAFSRSLHVFRTNKMPEKEHKLFIEVDPGNLNITRNQPVTISVINPEQQAEHKLFYKSEDIWKEITLFDYRKTFPYLDGSIDYYLTTPYAISDTFRISVFELPVVKKIVSLIKFPKYINIADEKDSLSTGNFKVIRNSIISFEYFTNNPINSSVIYFEDGSILTPDRTGKQSFKTSFTANKTIEYYIELKDFLGNQSDKIQKSITVIDDKFPEIKFTKPAQDTIINQNMQISLKLIASDDFGLKNLTLHYLVNQQNEKSISLKKQISGTSISIEYDFDLSEEFLLPGDEVVYWAKISDNSPEEQTSQTQRFTLRFPSITEIYEEIETMEKENSNELIENLKKSEELQKEFEEKRRELMKKDEIDWQDKKELEKMLEKQEDLSEQIENVSQEYDKMIEKFQENKALSQETIEKMEKIKELMQEISSQELQDAMQKMQQSMENLDKETLMKAMEDFKFSMEEYSQKLDQTIELLENIKKEQSLQKALEIAEEMKELQDKLMDKTTDSKKSDNQKLSEEQKQISEQLEELKKQLEKTDELLDPQKDKEAKSSMEEILQDMEKSELQQDMQESMEALKNDQKQQAQKAQKQASQKMEKMISKMQNMKNMMSSGNMQQIQMELQKTIKALLLFSKNHEESAKNFVNDAFAILPQQISNFEGIEITISELFKVPQIIMFINPKFFYDQNFTMSAYRSMFSDINDAKFINVSNYLKDIQKGINSMIYDLMQSSNNMQSGGGGGGMQSLMQMMQQMGQQQMAMNMLTQQLMQQLGQNGGRVTQEIRQQMERLAAEEQRLADNLKRALQKNQEAQKQSSGINKIVEELEEISKRIASGKINNDLIQQQQRILSRLLDIQKSVHKREFTKKREGTTSDQLDWQTPEEILLEFQKLKKKALLDQDLEKYPQEYRDVIKEYFRILNEKTSEEKN